MRFRLTGRKSERVGIGLLLLVLGGCASPPAVTPLLRVVDQAIEDAHDQLGVDRQRAASSIDRQRQALTDAFDADLADQTTLTTTWVRDHAMVYATAREVLTQHAAELKREFDTRQANLRDARRAQRAAIELIEQQDALFKAVPDARRWLGEQTTEER